MCSPPQPAGWQAVEVGGRGDRGGVIGADIAEAYDSLHEQGDTELTVEALAHLAGLGPVLELGVGTGRVAIPLAARGLEVVGLDASPEMLAQLRHKDGSGAVTPVLADMADFVLPDRFALVYVVYNALFGLLTQDDQVRCVAGAARHLAPSGHLVIEAFSPKHDTLAGDRILQVRDRNARTIVSVGRHDPVAQLLDTRQIHIAGARVTEYQLRYRYVWPTELDLMGRLAGLQLRARWADWTGRPFSANSTRHISVYRAGDPTPPPPLSLSGTDRDAPPVIREMAHRRHGCDQGFGGEFGPSGPVA